MSFHCQPYKYPPKNEGLLKLQIFLNISFNQERTGLARVCIALFYLDSNMYVNKFNRLFPARKSLFQGEV